MAPLNPWKLTGYKPGQNVACQIMAAEPGGYAVLIPRDNLPGFLPTEAKLKIGEDVLAQFVCVHNNRVLLSARFSGSGSAIAAQQGSSYTTTAKSAAAQIDWSAQVATGADPADAAFSVWAQTVPRKIHLRRATDLILPPVDGQEPQTIVMGENDLEWLITDLEGGMRTGCVKASSEEQLSRSAMLLYRGRAVGCIYGRKSMPDSMPTEQALSLMLQDLSMPSTKAVVYDLPPEVTLAMSALFLGYPVQRSDDLDARSYIDYLCGWFAEKGQTACLAITLPAEAANCLLFVTAGSYVGAFYVEDQKFNKDKNFVYELLARDANAGVAASILPPEMTSQAVRFGFSLSMASKKQ